MAGLGGLALIAGPSAASGQDLLGAFLVLLGSISWAAGNVLTKARFSNRDMLAVTGIQMFFGAAGLFLLTLIFEPLPLPKRWTPDGDALILFTGILASAFSFFAWFYALSRLPAGKTTFSVLLVPVFALLFDWLQMDEPTHLGDGRRMHPRVDRNRPGSAFGGQKKPLPETRKKRLGNERDAPPFRSAAIPLFAPRRDRGRPDPPFPPP